MMIFIKGQNMINNILNTTNLLMSKSASVSNRKLLIDV